MSLVEASVEVDVQKQRFTIHPLTRSFALARLNEEPDSERDLRSRWSTYYTERCRPLGKWGYTESFSWLEGELPNILAVIDWAESSKEWSSIAVIFQGIYYFLGTKGYWDERIRYGYVALEASRQSGDRLSEAVAQYAIAWILQPRGQHKEAQELLLSCIRWYIDSGCNRDAAIVMITLAEAALGMGDLRRARQIVADAYSLLEQIGDTQIPSGLLKVQAEVELQSGNLDEAENLMHRAVEAAQGTAWAPSLSTRYIGLGRIALRRNQLDEAEREFNAGLESSQRYLRQDNSARAMLGLARVHALRNDRIKAAGLARSAHEQFTRMGMKSELDECDALLTQLAGFQDANGS